MKEMGAGRFTSLEQAILAEAVDKLRDTYLQWIESSLALVDEQLLWHRQNPQSNSIGNLLLHLEGNVRQWIVSGLGGKKDTRNRNGEFALEGGVGVEQLFDRLEETVQQASEVILGYSDAERLLKPLTIQGFATTPISAIIHVVEHFAYHTGQIVWSVKYSRGVDMKFYGL